MDSLVGHVLMRVFLCIASVASFVVAAFLVRAAHRLSKRAKMGRLAASLLDFVDSDFQDVFRLLEQRRSFRHSGMDRVFFKSALLDRYIGAAVLLAFGVLAAVLLVRDLSS